MADAFSDYLGVTPPPVAAGPAAIPPPPKMGFMDVLAGAFGAGPNKEAAYQKGLDSGSQYRLRTAQTESAMALAEKNRKDAMRQSQVNDLVTRAQSDPNFQPTVSDLLTMATGAGDFTTGRLHEQELGFRGSVADPTTPQPQRLSTMEAITGRPVERYYQSGTGMQANQLDPAAPPVVTPVGEAQIGADNALAHERMQPKPAAAGAGLPFKIPANHMLAPDGQSVEPIPGSPADPNSPAPQGAREAVFTNRVLAGAAQSVAAMQNIMRMPVGASTGVMGIGASPGKGIFESAKNALRNLVSADEVQQYTVALSGLSRNLATIETQGLSPAGSFIGSLDSLQLREGDDQFTKLVKLAEVRQTVEAGLDPLLNNPRVPPQVKDYARALLGKMQQAVPFTWEDVQELQKAPEGATLGQLLQQKGGTPNAPAAPGAPTAGPVDPRVKQYADQYLGGDVAKATAILKKRGAIP